MALKETIDFKETIQKGNPEEKRAMVARSQAPITPMSPGGMGGTIPVQEQAPITPMSPGGMGGSVPMQEQAVDIWDGGVGSLHEMLFTPSPELDNDSLATLAIKPFVEKGVEEAKKEIKVSSLQDIGMNALGFNPNTATLQDGGLIGMAAGMPTQSARMGGGVRNFEGQVPGIGHGMEDNVYMPIVERSRGQQVATLAVSPDEYVVDAHTMSALGNGSADEGARYMDGMVKNIRKKAYGTNEQPNEINGLAALRPMIERV